MKAYTSGKESKTRTLQHCFFHTLLMLLQNLSGHKMLIWDPDVKCIRRFVHGTLFSLPSRGNL